ncbi:MAG TPA: nicotinate phosphoribosyltransferase [Candidatus Dormibacteraeota bacterium]|nr:nicotinate phosphoribosyltransferase [Candidatus Dormibacteraeota bacterium]
MATTDLDRAATGVTAGSGLAAAGGYGLSCDEYELTMAQSFLRHGQTGRAVFELFVRSLPPHRGFLVAAGLGTALDYLERLRFDAEDLAWLARTGAYGGAFLDHLAGLRFTGDVDAVAEGTPVGAAEPILRVSAPRVEATLVESALLAIVNHETVVATKAARIVGAAAGRPVLDFSLRRLHGPDAALGTVRAAWIGGVAATATVAGGRRLGVPTSGTMAHHFVLAFGPDGEQAAFEQFLRDAPGRAVLLVDTYDTLRGTNRAIAASRATGVALAGVRIDSGDIASVARAVRAALDGAGMRDARVVASGDLDEWRINDLVRRRAPVDAFGVGTSLGTSTDAPALGAVYKLVAQEDAAGTLQPVMKRSEGKATDPGVHQVWRTAEGDVLGLASEPAPEGEPLLRPVMTRGRREVAETLDAARDRCATALSRLPEPVRRLTDPVPLRVRRSALLDALSSRLSEGGTMGGTVS